MNWRCTDLIISMLSKASLGKFSTHVSRNIFRLTISSIYSHHYFIDLLHFLCIFASLGNLPQFIKSKWTRCQVQRCEHTFALCRNSASARYEKHYRQQHLPIPKFLSLFSNSLRDRILSEDLWVQLTLELGLSDRQRSCLCDKMMLDACHGCRLSRIVKIGKV